VAALAALVAVATEALVILLVSQELQTQAVVVVVVARKQALLWDMQAAQAAPVS